MSIQAAYAVPHPPLIVPSVGRGEERAIADTISAYENVAQRIAEHEPDVLVVISPHAPLYRDCFFVSSAPISAGSMARFGAPQERIEVRNDTDFQQLLAERMESEGIFAARSRESVESLDHATFVPLYFVRDMLPGAKLVRIGLSGLSNKDHVRVGRQIASVAKELNRKAVIIASGDLSHKLTAEGPYGFNAAGPLFDEKITSIFERGSLDELTRFDDELCEKAAECGLRSFEIMSGALDGLDFASELLSYEGPFGVGYGIAAFEVADDGDIADGSAQSSIKADGSSAANGSRAVCETAQNSAADDGGSAVSHALAAEGAYESADVGEVDPLVALARVTVEAYVRGEAIPLPCGEAMGAPAGVFVSLHEGDSLRGCIGTIEPVHESLSQEIISNAISACSRDPRFMPVRPDELDFISYSVDVLTPAIKVSSLDELDPERYGVIVSLGGRRGLLLPDLDGVDTVEQQLAIAMRKAGIPAGAPGVQIERFEVVRHSAGGQARRDA